MSGVFQILTPHPLTARLVCTPPPAFGTRGGHTRWVERGWGVNILEDARHCSVLYIRKYFVDLSMRRRDGKEAIILLSHESRSTCEWG
jgi:hypothetical protein